MVACGAKNADTNDVCGTTYQCGQCYLREKIVAERTSYDHMLKDNADTLKALRDENARLRTALHTARIGLHNECPPDRCLVPCVVVTAALGRA